MHKIKVQDIIPKKDEDRFVIVDWNGKKLKVKYAITPGDIFDIATRVTDAAFSKDDVYTPELASLLAKCLIIDKFTNIEIPADMDDGGYLVYETDLFDIVRENASDEQLGDIYDIIEKKINYELHTRIKKVEDEIVLLEQTLDEVQGAFSTMLDGVSKEDFDKLIDVMANGKIDEEKLVDAVIAKEAEEAK